jgi:CheY-like chemotaxis protein
MPIRILLVEDHEPFRQLVCALLAERAEFQVIGQASEGLEAIQKAQKLQPDLILLDIGLPKLNGIAAAQQIAKVAPKAKIIFLSQNIDAQIVRAALNTGGSGYVVKSDAPDQLFEALETVIQGGQFLGHKLKRKISDDIRAPWKIVGKVLAACNCDWGCPCNFNGLPTTGKCEGGWTWHVEQGAYRDVRLDGLNFSLYVNWPGAVHHGNGVAVFFIDECADNSQRSVIATLVGGTAGGPWSLLAATWLQVHGPYTVGYDIAFDGVKTEIKCGDLLEIEGGPIRNPVTGAESHPRVLLPEGIIFKAGDVGASMRFRLKNDVQYDHSGKYFAIGGFDYSGTTA